MRFSLYTLKVQLQNKAFAARITMLILPNATDGSTVLFPTLNWMILLIDLLAGYLPLIRRHLQKLRDRSTEHLALLMMHNLSLLGQPLLEC